MWQVSARRASALSRALKLAAVAVGALSRQTAESTVASAVPLTTGAALNAAGVEVSDNAAGVADILKAKLH